MLRQERPVLKVSKEPILKNKEKGTPNPPQNPQPNPAKTNLPMFKVLLTPFEVLLELPTSTVFQCALNCTVQ